MVRKVHITESQLEELKCRLNELDVNADSHLASQNGNMQMAAKKAEEDADRNGVPNSSPKNITFSDGALKKFGITSESYSKKQVKEAMLKRIMDNCEVYRKGDL